MAINTLTFVSPTGTPLSHTPIPTLEAQSSAMKSKNEGMKYGVKRPQTNDT
jgi:hypothetical protein